MRKVKLSIIIVYYKEKRELFNCLESIGKNSPKVAFEVIVVDNSEDGIEKEISSRFGWVSYVKSPYNLGYGGGNNLGVSRSSGEFLLILNPDTLIKAGAIDNLLAFLKRNKDVGVVAPNLVDKEGKVFAQLGSRELTPVRGIVALSFLNKLFPNNPISRQYWLKDLPLDKRREVDVVPGSAFLIKRSVFEKAGRFDENMFLFFEESDLGRRIRKLGYRLYIIPEAEVVHFWRGRKSSSKEVMRIFRKSRFYYFKKHFGFLPAVLVELFARFSKWHFIFIVIFMLAMFVYNLYK